MARGRKKETLTLEERLQAALVPESEQPYKVPGNWCWVQLGPLLSEIKNGTTIKQDKSGIGFKVTRIESLQDQTIDFDRLGTIVNEQEIKDTDWYLAGDIALSHINSAEHVGKTALINANMLPLVHGMNLLRLRFYRECCIPLFFQYFSQSFQYKDEILSRINMAVNQVSINQKQISSLEIPLPPFPEQQRIVDRIESLFAKLDEAKQKVQDAVDSFETRKAAILHKAFTGELIGKHSTATTTLEEITTCIRIGPFGSALHKEDYILGGVPVVNPKHIVQQKIVPEEKTTVSVQKAEELSSYILQKNDIILGRRGDMGRSAPVTDLEIGWLCGTGSMIIRLKSGYNAKFYSQIIASQAAVRYLEENSVGSTMKNLNEKVVRLLPIPDFTVDEQLEIVHILDNLLAKEQQAKEAAEKVLEQIDLIKKAILARAFRGKLGTNDPNEEGAVELLKQILARE